MLTMPVYFKRLDGRGLALLSFTVLNSAACVVEQIDAVIAEHGVTYSPASTGESEGPGPSTSTGTTADSTSGETGGAETSTTSADTTGTSSPADSSGSGDSSTGDSSTGPADPVCGDGLVQLGEACDDGNLVAGDGCQECATDSLVFISSEVYQGFALGGLYGADQRCRSLAAKAGLLHPETFVAWLSTAAMPAADRLKHSPGRYLLVNGLVVAESWTALTSGSLKNPIMVDEYSQTRDTRAWTGTLVSGQPAPGSEFCEDWDDDSGLLKWGGTGLSVNVDSAWSFFEQGPCDSELRLYCFQG